MCQTGAGKTTILVRTFYKDRMEVSKSIISTVLNIIISSIVISQLSV